MKERGSCGGQSWSLVVLQLGDAGLSPPATEKAQVTVLLAVAVSLLSSTFTPGSLCALVSHHPHCMGISLPHPPLTVKPAHYSGDSSGDEPRTGLASFAQCCP